MSSEWIYIKSPQINEFFGELKHRPSAADQREVELVVKPDASLGFELAMAALALDGSRSMQRTYGAHLPKLVRKKQNKVHPTAQDLALFLAANARDKCAVAYWACGDDGSGIEPIDILDGARLQVFEFAGPQQWGGGTKLAFIVEYFWDMVFLDTDKEGVAVILTDGAWDDDDHARVLQLTQRICEDVAAGRRKLMKCVVLGIKTDDNKGEIPRIDARFNALNNYDSGTEEDIWYTNWVDEMNDWNDIFIELVKKWSLGVGGYIEVNGQKLVQQDEFNFGMQFEMPLAAASFTLHLEGVGDYVQNLA
jgi:hypothetical protein